MKKQNKIQLTLLIAGLALIVITYFYYPSLENDKIIKSESLKKSLEENLEDNQDTAFENVNYEGLYNERSFTVEAEKAHILKENPNIVFMKKMHVTMYLKEGRIVNITSKKGRFNKDTYDCFFEVDVRASDGETEIFSENLDLLATKSIVEVYNNVKLNHTTGSLRADTINYDFETKFFKVSMFNDKKIKMKIFRWFLPRNLE